MKINDIGILQRALNRERLAKKQAEKILEEKSQELFSLAQKHENANILLQSLLRQKDLEFETIFSNSNDAYVLVDNHGNIKKVNEYAINMFGMADELTLLNALDIVHDADKKKYSSAFKKMLSTGSLRNFSIRIKDKKDKIKTLQVNATVIYDDQSKPIGAHGIARDITEQEIFKKEIQDQKRQLDIIIENSPVGIALFDENTKKILKTNKSLCEMTGYTEKELLNLNGKDLTHRDDFDETKKVRENLHTGKVDSFLIEKRYIKKDGSTLWAKTYAKSIKNEKGDIEYNIALIEDITQQREKTEMLETINNIARSILGKIDVFDIAKHIVVNIAKYLQSNYCTVYLVDIKKSIYTEIAVYNTSKENNIQLDKKSYPINEGIVGDVIKKGKAEFVNDTSKDSRCLSCGNEKLSLISVPIINNGNIIGVINSEHHSKNHFTKANLLMLKNIARIVSMQFKNAINVQELKIAEQRNIELLKELEASNNELQEYAHVVSHDLKSPLRSISSLISWTKEDYGSLLNKEVISNINIIESKVELMDHLIDGILQYSSIDWESTKKEEVNINVVIKNILQIIHIPDHINIVVQDELPIVNAHKLKMQQLFQNLLSNAVKYNDKSKGEVVISAKEDEENYTFSIKDNGIGINEKYHKRIFKMFNKLTNDEHSTGIGLSIVKKIVDLYKGKIWLESEVGTGTTFYFTINKTV